MSIVAVKKFAEIIESGWTTERDTKKKKSSRNCSYFSSRFHFMPKFISSKLRVLLFLGRFFILHSLQTPFKSSNRTKNVKRNSKAGRIYWKSRLFQEFKFNEICFLEKSKFYESNFFLPFRKFSFVNGFKTRLRNKILIHCLHFFSLIFCTIARFKK